MVSAQTSLHTMGIPLMRTETRHEILKKMGTHSFPCGNASAFENRVTTETGDHFTWGWERGAWARLMVAQDVSS